MCVYNTTGCTAESNRWRARGNRNGILDHRIGSQRGAGGTHQAASPPSVGMYLAVLHPPSTVPSRPPYHRAAACVRNRERIRRWALVDDSLRLLQNAALGCGSTHRKPSRSPHAINARGLASVCSKSVLDGLYGLRVRMEST